MGPVSDHEIWLFAQRVDRLCKAQDLVGGSKVTVMYNRRYARIVHEWGKQTMCWGWVDKLTGDVYRGGWRKPDTRYGAHTNIAAPDLTDRIHWTGPAYKKLKMTKGA